MIKNELGPLACRLMALWLFFQVAANLVPAAVAIMYLGTSTGRAETAAGASVLLFGCIPHIVLLLIGVFLWLRADSIGSRLVPSDNPGTVVSSFTAHDALSVGFAVLGMYLLLIAIPELGRRLATLQVNRVAFSEAWSSPRWQVEFWIEIIQIALGVWLLIGARGIARAVRALQRRDAPENIPPNSPPPSP